MYIHLARMCYDAFDVLHNSSGTGKDNDPCVMHCHTRVGGVKVSRLAKMVNDMKAVSQVDDTVEQIDESVDALKYASVTHNVPNDRFAHMTWEEQIREERSIFVAAADIIRDVRTTNVHRQLPHYHAVDRQLQTLFEQFQQVSIMVRGVWRYGRDLPISEILNCR